MENTDVKEKAVNGFRWGVIDNFAYSGITFLVGIVLANLLTPAEFGVIAIITIFVNISITIIDGGFATALIRKIDTTEADYNTVFYSNLAVSMVVILCMISGAPYIASFFNQPILRDVTIAMSGILLINACSIIPKTILVKQIDFQTQAIASLISSLVSGVVGISMACLGYGVWSIVFQQLTRQLLFTVYLWIVCGWRPRLSFSTTSFTELFGFGAKVLIANIINSVYKDMFLAVIGKAYSAKDLGYYNRAEQFNQIFSNNLTLILQKVSLPSLTQFQNDIEKLRYAYRKFSLYSAFITFALVFGLAAMAKPVTAILVGEKWFPSVHLLQIISLYGAIYPLQLLNLNILNILKRSDRLLRLEIIKKFIFIPVIIVGFFFQLEYMLWAAVLYYYIEFFINSWYSKEMIGYGSLQQIKDVAQIYIISIGVSLTIWPITLLDTNYWIMLTLQVSAAILLYTTIYKWRNIQEYNELTQIFKHQISNITNRNGK